MKRRILLLGLVFVLAGCVSARQSTTSPAVPTPASSPPTEASPGATLSPEPSPASQPARTARPTRSFDPSPSPTLDSAEPMPPLAQLGLPDGSRQAAALGSYDYGGAAADGPWLPARGLPAVEVQAGSKLTLSVAPLRFVRWGARYADAADEQANVISPLAAGGDGVASLESALLPAPPSGSWVVMVQLYFADEEGDAAYYWHLQVP